MTMSLYLEMFIKFNAPTIKMKFDFDCTYIYFYSLIIIITIIQRPVRSPNDACDLFFHLFFIELNVYVYVFMGAQR